MTAGNGWGPTKMCPKLQSKAKQTSTTTPPLSDVAAINVPQSATRTEGKTGGRANLPLTSDTLATGHLNVGINSDNDNHMEGSFGKGICGQKKASINQLSSHYHGSTGQSLQRRSPRKHTNARNCQTDTGMLSMVKHGGLKSHDFFAEDPSELCVQWKGRVRSVPV